MEGIPEEKEVLLSELASLRMEAHKKDMLGFHEKVVTKAEDLKKKYPDFANYELFHLLISSTLPRPMEKFDFPGDDSIEKFLRSV